MYVHAKTASVVRITRSFRGFKGVENGACTAEWLDESTTTTGYLACHPVAQNVVHGLNGLAYRARVVPARSLASHCKQHSALTSD